MYTGTLINDLVEMVAQGKGMDIQNSLAAEPRLLVGADDAVSNTYVSIAASSESAPVLTSDDIERFRANDVDARLGCGSYHRED